MAKKRKMYSLSVAFLIALTSCWLPQKPSVKPPIFWKNYGEDDGLGSGTSFPAGSAARASNFEPIPIDGGLGCQDLCIVGDGETATIWAATEDQLLYSRGIEDGWHLAMDGPPPSGNFTNVRDPTLDDAGRIWTITAKAVWRSSDNGGSWEQLFSQPNANTTFVDLFSRGSTIWAASRDDGHLIRFDAGSGQYSEWKATSDLLWRVCEASDGRVYIVSAGGVLVSTNGGTSFQVLRAYPNNDASRAGIAEINGAIWALVSGELMQLSTDGTLLWSSSANGLCGIDCFAESGGVIWALCFRDGPQEVVYRIDTGQSNMVEIRTPGFASGGTVAIDDSGRLYVSYPGAIAMSDNNGEAWQLKSFSVNAVQRIGGSGGRVWAIVYGGRIARWLPEADRWEQLGYLGWVNEISILFCPSEDIAFFGFRDTVHFTLDGGATTTPVSSGIDNSAFTGICGSPDGTLYASILAPYGVPTSNDHRIHLMRGRIGEPAQTELAYQGSEAPRYPDVAFDPNTNTIMVSSTIGLFTKERDSIAWQQTRFLLPCFDIEVSPSGAVYMLGKSTDQGDGKKMSLYRKSDQQWLWTEHPVPEAHCDSRIAIDGDGYLWVTSMSGLKLSIDQGASWFSYTMQDGLASDYIHTVYVQGSGASKRIWVGTAMGASRGIME
jgi:hypothetical protein